MSDDQKILAAEMAMLRRVPRGEFPTYAELRAAWTNLVVSEDFTPRPAMDAVIDQVRRENVNGGAIRASFAIAPEEVFDWLVASNKFKFLEFPGRLFTLPAVQSAIPSLGLTNESPVPEMSEGGVDAFEFDGWLARWIYNGGAYSPSPGTMQPGAAKRMAVAACHEIVGDRFDEIVVFANYTAWCPFFRDVAWDMTCVVLDRRARLVHILCSTDTD
jgi:hypothetical protein